MMVQVHAASVNPADWHLVRGLPFIARLTLGLRSPKDTVLGCDLAGRVEAVGKNVTSLQPGDEVFGSTLGHGYGALAEYVCLRPRAGTRAVTITAKTLVRQGAIWRMATVLSVFLAFVLLAACGGKVAEPLAEASDLH